MTGPWPLHPPPGDGEALTSWLNRLAEVYGMKENGQKQGSGPKKPTIREITGGQTLFHLYFPMHACNGSTCCSSLSPVMSRDGQERQ